MDGSLHKTVQFTVYHTVKQNCIHSFQINTCGHNYIHGHSRLNVWLTIDYIYWVTISGTYVPLNVATWLISSCYYMCTSQGCSIGVF